VRERIMSNDREIARAVVLRPVREVAAELGIGEEFLVPCCRVKAKILFEARSGPTSRGAIMVTAMTDDGRRRKEYGHGP
jgi:formyltetrahydrofolate synthetase